MTLPEFADEDSIVFLALDIPNPRRFAEMLLVTRRELARELLAAKKVKGVWKYKYDPDPRLIQQLRELGLCCCEPVTVNSYELTHWAIVVRNRLILILKARELEVPLENEGEET